MIELPAEARDAVVAHAREGAPEEVCGVLGGAFDATGSRVASVHRADNAAARPRTEYEIDPEEGYRILERIEADGEDPVGFYHSHPRGPPGPSATDAARAYWPGYSYLIVVLDPDGDGSGDGAEPTVGSWRWTGEQFEREGVRIVEGE